MKNIRKIKYLTLALNVILSFVFLTPAWAGQKPKLDDYQMYLKSGDKSPKWDDFIEPAFQSFDSSNLSTAYVFLKRAYDQGCRDPFVLFRLGLYYESRGNYKEAANLLREAAEKMPKRYPTHPLAVGINEHAGRVLYQVDLYDQALPYLLKAAQAVKKNFMANFMAGQILRNQGRYDEAKKFLEAALAAPLPENIPAADARQRVLKELTITYCELKEYDACGKTADDFLILVPNDQVVNSYRHKAVMGKKRQKDKQSLENLVK